MSVARPGEERGESGRLDLLVLLCLLVIPIMWVAAVRYGIALYRSLDSRAEVTTIGAGCFDPETFTGWGVRMRRDRILWRTRMIGETIGSRVGWREFEQDGRDMDAWLQARVCFATDAQRNRWVSRMGEVGIARVGNDSELNSSLVRNLDEPATCALWMTRGGATYVERWSQDSPPGDAVERLHRELLALGWPGEAPFSPPDDRLNWAASSQPPIDCEGRPLPGYGDVGYEDVNPSSDRR